MPPAPPPPADPVATPGVVAVTSAHALATSEQLGKRQAPPGLTKFESSLWAAFELADRNGNGKLSRLEFSRALKAVGLADADSEVAKEWKEADPDNSGSVEWKEFLKLGKRKKVLAESDWVKLYDPNAECPYWYNQTTGKSSYTPPPQYWDVGAGAAVVMLRPEVKYALRIQSA